jgi:N-methylhydantoinase A
VTDAHVVLGRLSPDYFLGGGMRLDVEAARRAIDEHVAQPLGLSGPEAAEGILRVVNASMVKGMRHVSVQRGHDPREFVLVAFGGAGPLHAVELALEMGLPQVLIPPTPGVHSAQGLLEADFRHDYVHTSLGPFTAEESDTLNAAFARMEADALEVLAEEGLIPARTALSCLTTNGTAAPLLARSIDLRYAGQGSELEVPLPEGTLTADTLAAALAEFHARHERLYGFQRPNHAVERVNLRLAAIVPLPGLDFASEFVVRPESAVDAARKADREVFLQGRWQTVAVYERAGLHPGHTFTGPAVIEQIDSTTLIYPGQTAEVDEWGNVVIGMC